MSVSVSAPGKAFLIGEYAVLEGAPSIVTAVDVRAIAHAAREDLRPTASSVVQCAHRRALDYLEAGGDQVVEGVPVVDTGPFYVGQRKLGLGSSAAVTAAVVGYHLAAHGLDPQDPEVQRDVLDLAMAAHAEAQGGGGSGGDVAAAVLGGTLRFEQGKGTPVTPLPGLHLAFVDSGYAAITSDLVRRVREAEKAQPARYAAAMAVLGEAARAFIDAFVLGEGEDPATVGPERLAERFAAIRHAVARHNEGLELLQALAGAPFITPQIATILHEADAAGLTAKPSGASGGDLVVVMSPDRSALERLGERLRREHGLVLRTDLVAGAQGLRAEQRLPTNSRLAGFFKLSVEQRRAAVAASTGLSLDRLAELDAGSFDVARANHMIENVVGTLELPLAIATNFRINGRDFLVPMCVEEASVVAAASNAAKMIRAGGGFSAHSDPAWMIAQVQLVPAEGEVPEDGTAAGAAAAAIREAAPRLLALADTAHPRLLIRGGGAREIEVRPVDRAMVVVHVLVDCQDAMGANLLNTVAETVAPELEAITGWQAGLRILSNLSDRRCAHVSARIPPEALVGKGFTGPQVVDGIVSASRFAELDPYRATTHNKGIMNGVDAVVLATGNDWRAMEASAHAFAARGGRYGPLAVWRKGEDGWLEGAMSLPAAVGVVGGATRTHPVARLALEILGCGSGAELGQVMAAAGLASNLAALRALATEGIQRGHMSLHARSVALGAGARGHEVEALARALVEDGEIKAERAAELLEQLRAGRSEPETES
ncbi:MAG: hydroxymethylglutaryl-CoA reductase, degradative [Myxococcales bacterium]|nr:hydroxymethylglutaryl-CoA reductase, degradative [Myxococcales bacterium]MCB9713594.1 hydroxymethylglutaryl-CoA reductase, degradative [Myxococcales bacterium]